MMYPAKVVERSQSLCRVGSLPREDRNVGTGLSREPAYGNVIRIQIRVEPGSGIIREARFKSFGCGWAIASASLAAEWIEGCTLIEATGVSSRKIIDELSLPEAKRHCADSAADAVRLAIDDYRRKDDSNH